MDIITYALSKGYTNKVVESIGKGVDYKGSVPTVQDLPTASSSNKGWLYTITSNGHEYLSDGTAWVDLSADLDNKQDIITDLSTIRSNAASGKQASDTISTYGNIVSHNTSEFATSSQGAKADTAVQPSAISDMATKTWVGNQGYLTQHQSLSAYRTSAAQDVIDSGKQATLVSGTNIKTINGSTILGSGDLTVGGSIPTITLELSQVIGQEPFEIQLTNEQYDTLVSSKLAVIDTSALEDIGVYFPNYLWSLDHEVDSSIFFGKIKADGYTITTYDLSIDKSTKVATLGYVDGHYDYTFNTAYDATTNKAATMADIQTAIGDAMGGAY